MKRIFFISAVLSIALLGVGCGPTQNTTPPVNGVTSMETRGAEFQAVGRTIAMEEVKNNNSQKSCFVAVDGSVYDLTPWIEQHPGGKEYVLGLCGTDGTLAFKEQHAEQRKPENQLAKHRIGSLAK